MEERAWQSRSERRSGGVRRGGQEEVSFSCSEGSRDPPSSKHSHSEQCSMKSQERAREEQERILNIL